jgi:hypothetical protein
MESLGDSEIVHWVMKRWPSCAGQKAPINRTHSRRFARFGDARQSRSVWSACVFSAAFPSQATIDDRAGSWRALFHFSECIGTLNLSVGRNLFGVQPSSAFRRSGPATVGTPKRRFKEGRISLLRCIGTMNRDSVLLLLIIIFSLSAHRLRLGLRLRNLQSNRREALFLPPNSWKA